MSETRQRPFKVEVTIKVKRAKKNSTWSTEYDDVVEVSRTHSGNNTLKLSKAKILGIIAECKVEVVEALNDKLEEEADQEEEKEETKEAF